MTRQQAVTRLPKPSFLVGSTAAEAIALSDLHARNAFFKNHGDQDTDEIFTSSFKSTSSNAPRFHDATVIFPF